MYLIVGLGNPGEEYENTRHNVGRMVVEAFCSPRFGEAGKEKNFEDFKKDKKTNSLKTEGKIGKTKILCLLPETFMNKSGSALKKIIASKKNAGKLIIVHDDIDLILGKFKISFGKGSAGHKGVESVMRAVKTKDFFRVRVGISPSTPKGRIKKPKGEKILNFLMGKFKPAEKTILKKLTGKIIPEIENIIQVTK
jgi:PTH1 family peptidyl-tRNA hydrolase